MRVTVLNASNSWLEMWKVYSKVNYSIQRGCQGKQKKQKGQCTEGTRLLLSLFSLHLKRQGDSQHLRLTTKNGDAKASDKTKVADSSEKYTSDLQFSVNNQVI